MVWRDYLLIHAGNVVALRLLLLLLLRWILVKLSWVLLVLLLVLLLMKRWPAVVQLSC